MVVGAQFYEQTKSHWLYNLNRWIVWYIDYILVKLLFWKKEKWNRKGQSCQELSLVLKCACCLHAICLPLQTFTGSPKICGTDGSSTDFTRKHILFGKNPWQFKISVCPSLCFTHTHTHIHTHTLQLVICSMRNAILLFLISEMKNEASSLNTHL